MLFVGDDWAEDHHDVELVDDAGRRLARARLPEGLDGLSRLHALIAEHVSEDCADLEPEEAASRGVIGIETDRGPRWCWRGVVADPAPSMVRRRSRPSWSTTFAVSHTVSDLVHADSGEPFDRSERVKLCVSRRRKGFQGSHSSHSYRRATEWGCALGARV